MSTSKEIIIVKEKTLKLHNLITKEFTSNEINQMMKSLMVLQGAIKARGLEPMGPLITHNSSTIEDNTVLTKVSVSTQLKKQPCNKIQQPYEYKELLKVPNCLYTRFNGEERFLHIAIYKMQVYAYENEMELTGGYYSIYIDNSEGVVIDLFMEVKNEE